MNETSKAMRRRWQEDAAGKFPWKSIFTGKGIDIGCGPDIVKVPDVVGFDIEDGDANHLSTYFPEETFDFVHSSQSLEHMHDPRATLHDWLKVVKTGGCIVCTIPSWELYEGMVWPSRYNGDHKATFSMSLRGSPAPLHFLVPEFLKEFPVEVLLCRLVDTNYDYKVGTSRDQTYVESDNVEAFIEFVICKTLL